MPQANPSTESTNRPTATTRHLGEDHLRTTGHRRSRVVRAAHRQGGVDAQCVLDQSPTETA